MIPPGLLVTEIDPRGYSTKYVYDARGLLTTKWLPDPDGEDPNTTGPQFRSWLKYTYDNQGRLVDVEETQLRHTSATYDNRDRITQVTLPDPDGSGSLTSPVISATYDNASRMVSQTDPLSRVTSATYDHEGRMLSITGPDPDGAGGLSAPVESYTYNALGSMLTLTDAGGHVTTLAIRCPAATNADDRAGSRWWWIACGTGDHVCLRLEYTLEPSDRSAVARRDASSTTAAAGAPA